MEETFQKLWSILTKVFQDESVALRHFLQPRTGCLMSEIVTAHPLTASRRRRLFTVLAGLYLAQAILLYLFAAALPPIMREAGVSVNCNRLSQPLVSATATQVFLGALC